MLGFSRQIVAIFLAILGTLTSVRAQPDLAPDLQMLDSSIFVQDVPLQNLICPRDENCLSNSASFGDTSQNSIFNQFRRLMRFSLRVINLGNTDFVPYGRWIWHHCHAHFHSVEQFAFYEILDRNGGRVAAGLKVDLSTDFFWQTCTFSSTIFCLKLFISCPILPNSFPKMCS